MRGALASTTDEGEVVVYARGSVQWDGKESESTESTSGKIRATRGMQLDAYGGHAGKS